MPSRFFQKVVSLSKTPADFKRPQTAAAPEDRMPLTVEDRTTSTVEHTLASTVEDRPHSTVEAGYWRAEGAPGVFTASRVRPVVRAQDSLTHVEEAVYDVLWGPKRKGEQEEHRTVTMGYAELAAKARVSKRTIQNVVARLIEKKFITIAKGADIYHRKAAVYQVRGYAAVIAAQRGEGKTWVLQTGRGVFFAHRLPSTVEDRSASTVEAGSPSTVELPSTVTVEDRSPSTVELPSTTSLGNKNKAPQGTSSSSSAVVGERLRRLLTIDDDAVRRIVASCRDVRADAAEEEIAYFAEVVIAKHARNPKIANLVGLLIQGAVAKYFAAPASELKAFREAKAEERRRQLEMAQEILNDPQSSEEAREWATEKAREGK
jgi:predicted transcriptional regulator